MREFHEVANIFPLLGGEEFDALKNDIAANGLMESIWLHPDGRIIDGRNRYLACIEAGIEPLYRTWAGDGSLVSFVVSLNLHRRHLTSTQMAVVGVDILPILEAEAHERKRGGQGGVLLDQKVDQAKERLPQSAKIAAKTVGTNHQYVSDAKRISEDAPDVLEMMRTGSVNMPAAKQLAGLDSQTRGRVLSTLKEEGRELTSAAIAKMGSEMKKTDRRAERMEKIVEISKNNQPLDGSFDRLFPLVYADPPWRYEHSETESREIENHYPTMTLDEICALPVEGLTTPDAILFLWATSPKLEESLQVINAWGFTYRTCFVWVKDRIGMGYYARQRHELLLVAKRGSIPVPEAGQRYDSVIESPRGKHSEKPTILYEMLDNMYPEVQKLEMFARNPAGAGWHTWGNQA